MQLQLSALANVRASRMSGPAIALMFERMLEDVKVLGVSATEITLDFQDFSLPALEGDVIPTIVLALRPAKSEPAPETLTPEKPDPTQ